MVCVGGCFVKERGATEARSPGSTDHSKLGPQELRGRATTEPAAIDGYAVFPSGADGHGHGTHCAGSAAGAYVGVCVGGWRVIMCVYM